jgi:hypothetical protein
MLPADCGVKVATKFVACPGFSVIGRLRLEKLNPVPEILAWEIVNFEFPLLARVTDFDMPPPS